MKISIATPRDIKDIAKIELGSGYHKNNRFNPLPMLKKIFKDKKEKILLAKENDKITGYIAVRIERKICEIALLAVLKRYQKRGIGKSLLKHILKIAKQKKANKVILEVRKNNKKALRLYHKYGFKVMGTRKIKNIIKFKMEKRLR